MKKYLKNWTKLRKSSRKWRKMWCTEKKRGVGSRKTAFLDNVFNSLLFGDAIRKTKKKSNAEKMSDDNWERNARKCMTLQNVASAGGRLWLVDRSPSRRSVFTRFRFPGSRWVGPCAVSKPPLDRFWAIKPRDRMNAIGWKWSGWM